MTIPVSNKLSRLLGRVGLAGGWVEFTIQSLRWRWRTRKDPPDRVWQAIRLFGETYPEAVFVQIGANDGMALDPLREQIQRRQWRGVMIEPVPYVFQRLHQRYGKHPRLKLINAAISHQDGEQIFFALREMRPDETVWPWYHALGSFRKDVILTHKYLIPDIEERIVEQKVPTLSFETMCDSAGLVEVDLLQIDTEGYDYEIIRCLPLSRFKPRLIVYEHSHLSQIDREACKSFLQNAGYKLISSGMDTAALDLERSGMVDNSLAKHFQGEFSGRPA